MRPESRDGVWLSKARGGPVHDPQKAFQKPVYGRKFSMSSFPLGYPFDLRKSAASL